MMKHAIVVSTLVCTGFAYAESRPTVLLENIVVDPIEVLDKLGTEHPEADFPSTLQGIWWMKDTPSSAEAVSLSRSQWYPEENRIALKLLGPYTYAYGNNDRSDSAINNMIGRNVYYDVNLNDDHTEGSLVMNFEIPVFGQKLNVEVPKFIFDFTMKYTADGIWERYTKVFGIPFENYELTRIVTVDGQVEDAMNDFINGGTKTERLVIMTGEE